MSLLDRTLSRRRVAVTGAAATSLAAEGGEGGPGLPSIPEAATVVAEGL